MTELTLERTWEQIETLRAQYALTIAKNQEIIVAARKEIARARELADQLPVAKTRKQKKAKPIDIHLTLPMYEGKIYPAKPAGVLALDEKAAEILGSQTMLIRDDV